MDESDIKKQEEVAKWLDDHVQVFHEPKRVVLSDFSVNWDDFSGDFRVSFDTVVLHEKLKFSLDVSGKTLFYLPMFCSVLGTPMSYDAIDISEKTYSAILRGLHETFPRLVGFGIDRTNGRRITNTTPVFARVGLRELEAAKEKVTKKYVIEIELANG